MPTGERTLVDAGSGRLRHLDDAKTVMTAAVIVAHACITYGSVGSWFYVERTSSHAGQVLLSVPVVLGSSFGMGLFFLVAARLTPSSLRRKGSRRFLRERWLRLGVPLAIAVAVLVPAVTIVVQLAEGRRAAPSLVGDELARQARLLDPGPLWFVGVLLILTTGYALVREVVPWRPVTEPLPARALVTAGVAVAAGSFVVRLAFPIDSFQPLALHLWQAPQCTVLFVLGILAAERGWLDRPLPDAWRRRCGWGLLVGAMALVVLLAEAGPDLEAYAGGVHWQAVAVDVLEGITSVCAALWVHELFRRRREAGRAAPPYRWHRSAYGAFVLQMPILVAVSLALRPVPAPALAKLAVVAPVAVVLSFATAGLLRRWTPVSRVL